MNSMNLGAEHLIMKQNITVHTSESGYGIFGGPRNATHFTWPLRQSNMDSVEIGTSQFMRVLPCQGLGRPIFRHPRNYNDRM